MASTASGSAPDRLEDWHAHALPEVLARLDAGDSGLSQDEAKARLERFGRNSLPEQPAPTVLEIVIRQFKSPLIYILVAAGVVAIAVGDYKDAVFIGLVLVINAAIGGYQEWRAEQSSRALQKMLQIRASVFRDGEVSEIPAEEVVPGDIIWIESGNRVPADLRLLSAHGLEVDESFLTGESLAVLKDPGLKCNRNTSVGDRKNMAYAGSITIRGRGRGVVVSTGMETAVGQLASDVMGVSAGKPPLLEQMERFAHVIAYAVLAAVVIVGTIGIVVHSYTPKEMFMFGVALAVSAIPEGLPAALTVALSVRRPGWPAGE